jgi:hypothetical protein
MQIREGKNLGSGIQDGKNSDPDKHPGSATLISIEELNTKRPTLFYAGDRSHS